MQVAESRSPLVVLSNIVAEPTDPARPTQQQDKLQLLCRSYSARAVPRVAAEKESSVQRRICTQLLAEARHPPPAGPSGPAIRSQGPRRERLDPMQQFQAFFGGGRNAEPDSSILAEWNKCASCVLRHRPEVVSVPTSNTRYRDDSDKLNHVSVPCTRRI